ncbi:sensor histidine kinase [Paenibacillus jiagnxiensis]|uniref:sensor histidine kinase n=1 Tax=Paenibacillus jiagnxiensis TaxID=3228926 RepID=UPI0033B006D8
MSFHRKIFFTMAAVIIGISFVFITLTHFIVRNALLSGINQTRGDEIATLADRLTAYYQSNNGTWAHLAEMDLLKGNEQKGRSLLVMDRNHNIIYSEGDANHVLVARLGLRKQLLLNHEAIGQFFYYDQEVANLNKIMIGIPISVVIIQAVSGGFFILISLVIAYQLSRWLASPLRKLLPAIERLGKGEFGVQATINTNDEYGKIANAFNEMSGKLEQAEQARRNLNADVAHELRTPLTIIGGKLDALQQQGDWVPPETLLPLQDELIRLNQLVEDLRTLSLAEAGELKLKKIPVEMAELVQSLFLAMEPVAEEKEISLKLETRTSRTTIHVDPNRIKQVLVNLLTNAIRYTPKQGTISFQLLNEDDSFLTMIVQDNGVGVSPEHLPHLFDRFYRTDEARTRDGGGTGLGLSIAKQFILAHNGTIEVESQLNEGTRFVIRLPY